MAFDGKEFEDQAWNDPSMFACLIMLIVVMLVLVGGVALWNYIDPPPGEVPGPISVGQK